MTQSAGATADASARRPSEPMAPVLRARMRLPRLAGFFLLVNAATFAAWLRHLRGERTVLWQPTER